MDITSQEKKNMNVQIAIQLAITMKPTGKNGRIGKMTDIEKYLVKKRISRLNRKVEILETTITVMTSLVFAGFLIKILF
ncbi:hypothetical protein [Fusobacterium sp.]|uniref:hypothetical protein n=1 Tax=Fusobacterium sp. TaxID=68766 RepID=UPI0025C4EF79|nr:hypothetical protein [Fusobacterium sp.]MCI7223299.1 hypothetical protein [Fusobacterium sp.]